MVQEIRKDHLAGGDRFSQGVEAGRKNGAMSAFSEAAELVLQLAGDPEVRDPEKLLIKLSELSQQLYKRGMESGRGENLP